VGTGVVPVADDWELGTTAGWAAVEAVGTLGTGKACETCGAALSGVPADELDVHT
jgi:hypothetical protein